MKVNKGKHELGMCNMLNTKQIPNCYALAARRGLFDFNTHLVPLFVPIIDDFEETKIQGTVLGKFVWLALPSPIYFPIAQGGMTRVNKGGNVQGEKLGV